VTPTVASVVVSSPTVVEPDIRMAAEALKEASPKRPEARITRFLWDE
jgi:hypothetical protein